MEKLHTRLKTGCLSLFAVISAIIFFLSIAITEEDPIHLLGLIIQHE